MIVVADLGACFRPRSPGNYWNGVFNYPDATDVALDNHVYQVFSPAENQRSWGEHLTSACNSGGNLRASPNWPIVGEWSLAVYDCARWLNGRGIGARYDGSYPGSYYIGSCGEWNTGSGQGFSK
jgi:glucan 1,3-beta-glucosidase